MKIFKNLDDTENDTENILTLIEDNSRITTTKLAEELNVSRSTIARAINKLKIGNKLRQIGADKRGHWKVLKQ